jgi:zinc protease
VRPDNATLLIVGDTTLAQMQPYGLPDSYLNDFVGEVEALTPPQLQVAGAELVHPEALTWIVVGDLSAIETNVRKLDIGEVKVLDVDGHVLR